VAKLQVLFRHFCGGTGEKDDRPEARTYSMVLVTIWRELLLEKLIVTQLVKEFPELYGTRIITVLTTPHL
jgi:hypothetical protein